MWLPVATGLLLIAVTSASPLGTGRHDLASEQVLPIPEDLTAEEFAVLQELYKEAVLSEIQEEEEEEAELSQTQGDELEFDQPSSSPKLSAVVPWPAPGLDLGQVAGVAVCPMGNLNVLHRADRRWDFRTFDGSNRYRDAQKGPIDKPVILTLQPGDGKLIMSSGAKIDGCDPAADDFCGFYLPHGLSIDSNGNHWITDVALHQVVRIPRGSIKPDLVLGRKLQPGSGVDAFCKPTDVAVLSDGSFYVADGYCNSRVLKYFSNGTRELEIGTGHFNVPHSLALREDLDLLCVADRENGRIMCYRISNNQPFGSITSPLFGGRLFAVEFHPTKPLLFAVNGPNSRGQTVSGFTIEVGSANILERWTPPSGAFSAPHDVTADDKGNVYVGEINPNKLWKLRQNSI